MKRKIEELRQLLNISAKGEYVNKMGFFIDGPDYYYQHGPGSERVLLTRAEFDKALLEYGGTALRWKTTKESTQ